MRPWTGEKVVLVEHSILKRSNIRRHEWNRAQSVLHERKDGPTVVVDYRSVPVTGRCPESEPGRCRARALS